MELRDELLTIERTLWTGGADAYRRNVDDECLVAFPEMAGVWSREEVATSVEGGERWRDPEIEVAGVLQPTPEVAILTYRASTSRGEDETYRTLVTSGYVQRHGAWKLAFHQQTPLAD